MRIKNAFRNSFFSVISQIILIIVGFFSQRVLNLRMGEELVGMNSVISNVIALLSVTELGISTAVVFHLYGYLASKDEEKIASLMNLYRKAYSIFAVVVSVLGLCILPFIHLFLKENCFSLEYIRLIYLLWLVRTVCSYLLSYKRSVLIADQQEYVLTIGVLIANTLNYLLLIIIVECWQNYTLALGLNIVTEIVLNLWISRYVDRKYGFLKRMRKSPLQKEVVDKVIADVKNIFVTRISAKLLLSTDNLIISSFISVGIVGLYSNYCMITQSLTNIVVALAGALQPTVGNMFVEKDHEKEYGVLRQITFIFFWIASFCSTGLLVLMTPFVTDIWLSKEYALDFVIILWCVINFFSNTISFPLSMMLGVTGLFQKEKRIAVIGAITNLIISLVLVIPLGIVGVLLGTFVSFLVQAAMRMRVLITEYMGAGMKLYFIELLQYVALTVLEAGIVYYIGSSMYHNGGWGYVINMILICLLVPNVMNLCIYAKSWRFRSILNMGRELLIGSKAQNPPTSDENHSI